MAMTLREFSDHGLGTIYIEGTDEGHEGWWRSTQTGAGIPYTNWNSGEPNNVGSGGEHCATLYSHGSVAGRWNDINCATGYNSVCEITNCKSTVIRCANTSEALHSDSTLPYNLGLFLGQCNFVV